MECRPIILDENRDTQSMRKLGRQDKNREREGTTLRISVTRHIAGAGPASIQYVC